MSLTDDSLRTAHFSMGAQSASSMPVLIRSNTTSLLDRASTLDQRDHRPNTLDYRTGNMDHRNNIMNHRTSTLDQRDHRTSTLDQRDHRTSTLEQRDHRTSTLDQRSKTMDRGCSMKEGQSRKLSMWVLCSSLNLGPVPQHGIRKSEFRCFGTKQFIRGPKQPSVDITELPWDKNHIVNCLIQFFIFYLHFIIFITLFIYTWEI